jgi:hypothetical protein
MEQEWQFAEWAITAMLAIIIGIVGFMYRDIRRELAAFREVVDEFSQFIIKSTERETHFASWRNALENRLNNHSTRMDSLQEFCTTSKEKIVQLEKWRDRVRNLDHKRSTDE